MAVHPAYSGRGHGARLVKWGVALARMDNVKLGVVARTRGESAYRLLGFERFGTFTLLGDQATPGGLDISLMLFDPASTTNETENEDDV